MALISARAGCKVAWETYTTREEAEARAATARSEAVAQAARGYDFGYLTPGTINEADNEQHGTVYIVTVP